MTEQKPANGDFIAAKISIYERVLAGLLKSSPHATEIEKDVRELVDYWHATFANAPLLARTGEETLQSLFSD